MESIITFTCCSKCNHLNDRNLGTDKGEDSHHQNPLETTVEIDHELMSWSPPSGHRIGCPGQRSLSPVRDHPVHPFTISRLCSSFPLPEQIHPRVMIFFDPLEVSWEAYWEYRYRDGVKMELVKGSENLEVKFDESVMFHWGLRVCSSPRVPDLFECRSDTPESCSVSWFFFLMNEQ